MHYRPCRVSGCEKPARSRYGTYCRHHAMKLYRHGALEQEGVTLRELRPTREEIRKYLDSREEEVWTNLRSLHAEFVESVRANLRALQSIASPRWQRQAYEAILKVSDDRSVTADDVVATIAGMWLLSVREPKRFASPEAFLIQLARVHRRLSDTHVAEHWQHTTGKVRRVFRDVPRRASRHHGETLNRVFGAISLSIIRAMEQEAEELLRKREKALRAIRQRATTSEEQAA